MTNSSKRNPDNPQNGNSKLSGDCNEINYKIKMACDDDVIVISVRMYKFFMAHGTEGREAKELYEHLIFTSRMQYGNPNVKATTNYLKKGLGWGLVKLKRAKAFLSNAGLIEYIQTSDDKTGKFGSQTILVKRMWDEGSLSAWIERKAGRSCENDSVFDIELVEEDDVEIEPVDKTGGIETDPPVKTPESEPVVCFTDQRSHRTTGDRPQTNKERERETYKREKEETTHEKESSFSPPAVSFSEIPDLIKHLESVIEVDGGGLFFFPQEAKAALAHYCKVRSCKWVLEQFDKYKTKKTTAQIRNFCKSDLPKFLTRIHESAPAGKVKKDKPVRICPVCGSPQPDSGTMNYCPRCTLPGIEFNDLVKIKEHQEWWDDVQRQREAAG